jgi:hypothetical protein
MVKIEHLPCISALELEREMKKHGYWNDKCGRIWDLFPDATNDSYQWLVIEFLMDADDELSKMTLTYLKSVGIIFDVLVSISW